MKTKKEVESALEYLFDQSKMLDERYNNDSISFDKYLEEMMKIKHKQTALLWVLEMVWDIDG